MQVIVRTKTMQNTWPRNENNWARHTATYHTHTLTCASTHSCKRERERKRTRVCEWV